ncbi:hypothetical protein VO64_2083 [Pseudomonas synxantha]|uniref:Uncharacterized protein n=1 Tax=Pseudomonas synxantha TaxID=47883 RepID=A0AAU8TQ47_9PSED|nr:hypothetical protein VO64_2083 [Pseudomonas synxantha]
MLAKIANVNVHSLLKRGAHAFFASKLAPTIASVTAVTPPS